MRLSDERYDDRITYSSSKDKDESCSEELSCGKLLAGPIWRSGYDRIIMKSPSSELPLEGDFFYLNQALFKLLVKLLSLKGTLALPKFVVLSAFLAAEVRSSHPIKG